MRFSDIAAGTLAETPCTIPGKKTVEGGPVTAALRVLDGADEARVFEGARLFAEARGAKDPKVGDILFDLGVMAHTLLVATVDTESPVNARAPFFSKAEEVLTLDRDSIALLYEKHEIWQNENSPLVSTMSAPDLFLRTVLIARAEDDGPFVELAPYMRSRWARITAKLLIGSPEARSLFGLPSQDSPSTDAH